MKTVRRVEISPGSVIDRVIRREIEQADDDIVEFDFNGVTVRVESDSDPEAKYREWREAMNANCQKLIDEKDRREHPERHWNSKPPIEPGWYWCRRDAGTKKECRDVVEVDDRWGDGRLHFRFGLYDYFTDRADEFQWAGPIPEPQD